MPPFGDDQGTRGAITPAVHCWCGPGSFTPGLGFDSRREHDSLEGEVCVVQTPVPKTGWRASVRVRLLHLPQLEDDLAVARAPFAKRMDPDGLRFDSAGFRAFNFVSHAPSQRAHTPTPVFAPAPVS